ncbi:allophanate hydrolase [soil metagenome]
MNLLTYPDAVGSLDLESLRERYLERSLSPVTVVEAIYARIRSRGDDHVWISLVDEAAALAAAAELDPSAMADLPLFGVPFAVKDNIDVAGMDTTAGCPAFGYAAPESAYLVDRLLAAGALVIGKTNLDQFATGLNGTRSPYGAPSTPFDDAYISGGSSSGSAVAVAAGLVSFSIGTDTAGSGRVPAALNNIVGVKPSVGLVSNRGIVPACRSIDCANVFALTVDDGTFVLNVIAGHDGADPWARDLPAPGAIAPLSLAGVRLAIPDRISAWGTAGEQEAWEALLLELEKSGVQLQPIAMDVFLEAGAQLYGGAWVAERLDGLESFITTHPEEIHPVTLALLLAGKDVRGVDVFESLDRMRTLRLEARAALADVDALLTPTVTSTFTIEQLLEDPLGPNTTLGTYTTFTNLLDLCAVAVPVAMGSSGLPFGVSVQGAAGTDGEVLAIARAIEQHNDLPWGALASRATETFDLAVVGAHLEGMPLHNDLLQRGARLVTKTSTAPHYRLYALDGTVPAKPGLRMVEHDGAPIEVEVYRLPSSEIGGFLATVVAPLAIGQITLEDGSWVHGFVCEPYGLQDARDITSFGSWRTYIASLP